MCNKYGKENIDKHFKKYIPMISQMESKNPPDPYAIVNRIYDHLKENKMLYENHETVKDLRMLAAVALHPKFWKKDSLPEELTEFMLKIDHDFHEAPGTNLIELVEVLVKLGCEVLCEKNGPDIIKKFLPLISESRKKQDKKDFTEIFQSVQQARELREKGLLN